MQSVQPSVGDYFSLANGEHFEVIGCGTRGIIIEYNDGRAELLDQPAWQRMQARLQEPAAKVRN